MSDRHAPSHALDAEQLERLRRFDPIAVEDALAIRVQRPLLGADGRLLLVAADHPARGALGVRGEPMAMADRTDLLGRLVTALAVPGVDGVLATPDIVEDLALLGALDDKVVVGSMNRGGLRGAAFEMDDRFTAYDVDGIVRHRLDMAKTLLRINLGDPSTARTLGSTSEVVTVAARARVPIMLEPFMSDWVDGRIVNDLSTEAVITSVAIASGLGSSSAYTWLKLPVVDGMERVMEATTLPTLVLGGDPGPGDDVFERWAAAIALPGVRGLVAGRSLLYPGDGDVVGAVMRAAALVHPAAATLPLPHPDPQPLGALTAHDRIERVR